ncbi:MAG: arylformamidase [Chloroflexi bacterium]|nr:arylformamidase [Chloroflexota bacterium]
MTIYDISRPIAPETPVFPGDTPYHVELKWRKSQGAPVNLTTITVTTHIGAHADAYYHYTDDGADAAGMPLDPYIGPARVVTVNKRDGALHPNDFKHVDMTGAGRLLIHSPVSELPDNQWPARFPYLSVDLIEWLVGYDVRLVGIDGPSVDSLSSATLPCHHALKKHNMVDLETLTLHGVPDGDYELIALPLKLRGACGSPVRAILRTLD